MNKIQKLKHLAKDLKVLLADDEEKILDSLSHYLSKVFGTVKVAKNGAIALELYQQECFDIIITDISMPVMDGIELIKNIRAKDENQEIIIISAFSDFHYLSDAISLNIGGYLLKPIEYDVLTNELYKSVYKIHLFKENQEYKSHLEQMVEEKSDALIQMQKEKVDNYEKTLLSMVEMIEDRDTYTAGHSERVGKYSSLIAKEMGHDEATCTLLYKAGILHDIGKIATPDSILLNPKKLNEYEYKLIQEHVTTGYKLLHKIPMFEEIAEIIYYHHEHYDGSGYPQGVSANEIPMLSHIMILADAFDAMTTNRIYRGHKSSKEALAEIEKLSSKQFHPRVVKAALNILQTIHIDNSINQLPQNELEKERFAYFYKDPMTQVHNKSYLDILLQQNIYEKKFHFLYPIFIHNFSHYNESNGWENGDILLKKFAQLLENTFSEALVFRIFGDDFAILSNTKIEISPKLDAIPFITQNGMDVTCKEIDLHTNAISSIHEVDGF